MNEGFNTSVFSYDEREWEKPVSHYQRDNLGTNTLRTTVCGFEDGNAYAKEGGIRNGNIVDANIAAYIALEELGVEHPEVAYDAEADILFIEEVEDTVPAHRLEGTPNEDSFWKQVASRAVIGDTDLYQNLLAYPDGDEHSFVNIDYDSTGHATETFQEENRHSLKEVAVKTGIEFEEGRLEEEIDSLRRSVDWEKLRSELDSNPFIGDSWGGTVFYDEGSVSNMVDNFRQKARVR